MIKFRAWNGYRKVMADYVSAIQNGDTQGTPSSVNVIVNGKSETWDVKNDRVELLRFTGLKDVNVKEIYEGDIARYTRWADHVGIVRYFKPEFELQNIGLNIDIAPTLTMRHELIIIGNIYENPELLEVKK